MRKLDVNIINYPSKNLTNPLTTYERFIFQHELLFYRGEAETYPISLQQFKQTDLLSGDNILHLTARGYDEYHPSKNYPPESVDAPNSDGETPLITAVRERNTKTAVGILRMRPDINLQDHKGNTALHYAILNHDSNAVGRLCEAGADTSLRNKKGKSCLHTAAALANVAMLRQIFRKQPESIKKINIQDHSNATPLLDATKKGNAKIIQDLLAKQACTLLADDDGNTPLHWAVITNNAQTTRLLARISGRHDPVNQNMDTPLTLAAKKGFGTIFGILIQYSVDWTLGGGFEKTLLHAACQSPSPILEFLLRSHIIRYLERNDDDGLTPFHYACSTGNEVALQKILQHEPDLRTTNKNGENPLMSAVINSHYNVCTILLQLPHFKKTINDTNVNGETALHFAFIIESEEIIKLLRLHGATLNTHASAYKFICQRFTPKGELLPPPTSCQHLVKRYRSTKDDEESNPSPMGN